MKPIVHFVLALMLCCNLAQAVYVDAPVEITLLPQDANLVYFAIYNNDVLKDGTIVFNSDNSCLNDLTRQLQKALNQSGIVFRNCYSLLDRHVEAFLSIANETQLMQQFQKENDVCCLRSSHFYEFNCYVQVVQKYLQKVDSYVHRPQNSVQWDVQYQVALSRVNKLTKCTGAELKSLMEVVKPLQDAAVQC